MDSVLFRTKVKETNQPSVKFCKKTIKKLVFTNYFLVLQENHKKNWLKLYIYMFFCKKTIQKTS